MLLVAQDPVNVAMVLRQLLQVLTLLPYLGFSRRFEDCRNHLLLSDEVLEQTRVHHVIKAGCGQHIKLTIAVRKGC